MSSEVVGGDSKSKVKETLISSMDKFAKHVTEANPTSISNLRQALPTDKYYKWYVSSYCKQMPKLSFGKPIDIDYVAGAIKRVGNFTSMVYAVKFNMLYQTVVVLKMYDYLLRKEVNYGTVFCENVHDIPDSLKSYVLNESDVVGNTLIRYYSSSASFISCDGEYRTRFCRYWHLVKTKFKYPNMWNDIDDYTSKIRNVRQWYIYPAYFHGRKSDRLSANFEIEKNIKSELIPAMIFNVTWFHAIYNEMIGMTETHLNATFKEIFLRYLEPDLEFMRELIKKYGASEVEMFKIMTSHSVYVTPHKNQTRYLPMGYKMIPLNIREVQDPLRLKYKPWREYLISNRCNDLVINQVAPGFPYISEWFYIRNSSKGLFDNKSQYERLKHSELAKEILRSLQEARRGTYFATSDLGRVGKSSENIKQWISTKFKRLNDKILDPINYTIEDIILSDIALTFATEYVGRTFADTVVLVGKSKTYDALIGKPFSDGGYDYFAKYIFEICYNLLAVNKKLGVIHGDFHLNNATIGFLYSVDKPNSFVTYTVDTDYTYVFGTLGYYSCLIDFSRGLINPENYEELIDKSLPETFKPVKNYDKFVNTELTSLMNLYLQLFPGKLKQKDELMVLFKNNYTAVFKLMTCIDLYMFSARLSSILHNVKYHVSKKAIDLVEKINRLSEAYIATDMNHMLNDKSYANTILANEWPIATIIKKCFPEYINGNTYKKLGTVIDSYAINNRLEKSLSKYDLYPEVVQTSKYIDDDGKVVEITAVAEKRKFFATEHEKNKNHSLEHVKFIAMKQMDFDANVSEK